MKPTIGGQIIAKLSAIVAGCCILAACAAHDVPRRTSQNDPYQQFGKWYFPITDSTDFMESGIASWYGHDFHGKKTSSGEVYDMHGMTAAHTILPLGTHVAVFNPQNGHSVIVRVNDRGPFVDDRIIDLSYEAASRLGISMTGTGRVVVVALDKSYQEAPPDENSWTASPPDSTSQSAFSLQMGSFTRRENAEKLKSLLEEKYENVNLAVFNEDRKKFYRVRVGRFVTREAAERALRKMTINGYENVKLVTE